MPCELALERVKVRAAVAVENRDFSVDHELPGRKAKERLDEARKGARPVIAAPRVKGRATFTNVRLSPVAIVFNLMNPVGPLRWIPLLCGQARRDEPRKRSSNGTVRERRLLELPMRLSLRL